MRTIQKKTLDELIRVARKYYKTADADLLPFTTKLSGLLSEQAFKGKNTLAGYYFSDIINAVINLNGQNTNQAFYTIFEAIGIKIKGDDEV